MRKALQPMAFEAQYPGAEHHETLMQRIRRERAEQEEIQLEAQRAEELRLSKLERRDNMKFILKAFGYLGMFIGGLASVYTMYVILWLLAG